MEANDLHVVGGLTAAPKFTLAGKYYCKVISCHDGDTFTGIVRIAGNPCEIQVRMYGYDSPELNAEDEQEHKAARNAKSHLEYLIKDKVVKLEILTKRDKYGRELGIVHIGDVCVNDVMVDVGYGVPYFGGKKQN